MPKYSLNDLDNGLFRFSRVAGEIFSVSLDQGGPAPKFLQEWCYHFLLTGILQNITSEDIFDPELLSLIKMVEDADDLSCYTDQILTCGYTGRIDSENKDRIKRKVWDAVSGDEVLTLAHKHIVKTVSFTQDSTCLLTGGNDKLLRIYDLNNPEAAPQEIQGHTSAIKKALWCNDDRQILSAADDKTIRLWDRSSMEELQTLTFDTPVSSMEYVADGEIVVITYGKTIAFYNALSLDLIKSVEAPAPINSASLHPEKDFFVAGGEDFKLYKFDYSTKEELESYKGHFGPVHCVRFSPDGELYASGSEDGTLRLWQTAVGKTYGLWKCVLPEDLGADNTEQIYTTPPEIKA